MAKTKSVQKQPKLDVGKAHADLALALEEHRMAGNVLAEAMKREAGMRDAVSAAQKIFDAAVEQVRTSAAPFDTAWWNSGRRTS